MACPQFANGINRGLTVMGIIFHLRWTEKYSHVKNTSVCQAFR